MMPPIVTGIDPRFSGDLQLFLAVGHLAAGFFFGVFSSLE